MIQKYIILLWLLFQLLVEINCQMKPKQRTFHTATHINSKLYVLGGEYLTANVESKDFFYLDVSVSFNTQNLLWQDLTSANIVPPHAGAASVKGGANNNTLFLYGGFTPDTTMSLVYAFDPQSNSWSIPKIAGIASINRGGYL